MVTKTSPLIWSRENSQANAEMIRLGFAWHYKTYNGAIELDQLETEAREAKRELWSDSQTPVAPWEWRKQQKAKQKKSGR